MPKVKWKKWAKAAAVLIAIDLIVSAVWLTRVLILTQDYELYPSEMGIVLMGDSADHYTALGKQTRQRLNHALELYRLGYFREILCVGGYRPVRNYSGAQLMKKYLVEKGVPAENILLEERSYDTMTNMSYTAEILRRERPLSVVLISSPLHVHRIIALNDSRYLQGRFVFYAPHPFFGATPPLNLWEMWKTIHYEWSAFAVRRLPKQWYQQTVRYLREQGSTP